MEIENIVKNRRLICGENNNLMAVSPRKHTWTYEMFKMMKNNDWSPEVVGMGNDVLDYNTRLTPAEKLMYNKALAFLSNLDGIQFNNLTMNIGQHITSPEVSMCIARQAYEEVVHVEAYSLMVEAVTDNPAEIYMMFKNDGMLAKKNQYIMESSYLLAGEFTPRNFALAVAANVILEGIYFYSGFLCFYVLAKNGKMVNSSDQIKYIQRDEITHLKLFVHMWNTLKVENPEIFDSKFYEDVKKLFTLGVQHEVEWGQYIISGGVLGLSDTIVENRIKFLGNERLKMLNMSPIFFGEDGKPVKDPCEWVETFSVPNQTDAKFFESKPTDYAKAGSLGDWE